MRELRLPKFNNNDQASVLVAWLYRDGEAVPADAVVAEVETSKAIEEVVVDGPVVLHRLAEAQSECAVGSAIALLFDSAQEHAAWLATRTAADAASSEPPPDGAAMPVLSLAAQRLVELHGIGMNQVRALGKAAVKASDIGELVDAADAPRMDEGTAGAAPKDECVELSRRQRAIAAVVSESHRTIPAAFVAVKVSMTAVLELREAAAAGDDYSLVELLVKAIVAQRHAVPMLFAQRIDDRSAVLTTDPGIAVTIDVGTGLFLPVVRGAERRPIAEIADQLLEFRIKAMRQDFRQDDFEGGHVTLSLHNEPGVVAARPIVFPGQAAAVVLCGPERGLRLGADGSVVQEESVTLGVAYDHRLANGREAMTFLQGIRRLLEDRDACAELIA